MFGWALVGIGGVAGYMVACTDTETSPEEYDGAGSSGRDSSSFKHLHHSPRYQGKVSSFLHKGLFVSFGYHGYQPANEGVMYKHLQLGLKWN